MKTVQEERTELLKKKSDLVVRKVELQAKLGNLKNLVRSNGRMSNDSYRQLCSKQDAYTYEMAQIESQIMPIKIRLTELATTPDLNKRDRENGHLTPSNPQEAKSVVVALVALRNEYQSFAADGTRVSSMRQMAAEFSLKLTSIIKQAIGS